MTIHTPNAGTGLSGEWLLGPSGGVRVDLAICPPDIEVTDPDAAWETVRDLLSAVPEKREPLEGPRRWRSTRGVHVSPVRHGDDAILTDQDRVAYSAPEWVLRVAVDDAVTFGVLVTDDTHHHLDVLVMRRRDEVVAFAALRRLS